jgi:hypothetical protein
MIRRGLAQPTGRRLAAGPAIDGVSLGVPFFPTDLLRGCGIVTLIYLGWRDGPCASGEIAFGASRPGAMSFL